MEGWYALVLDGKVATVAWFLRVPEPYDFRSQFLDVWCWSLLTIVRVDLVPLEGCSIIAGCQSPITPSQLEAWYKETYD